MSRIMRSLGGGLLIMIAVAGLLATPAGASETAPAEVAVETYLVGYVVGDHSGTVGDHAIVHFNTPRNPSSFSSVDFFSYTQGDSVTLYERWTADGTELALLPYDGDPTGVDVVASTDTHSLVYGTVVEQGGEGGTQIQTEVLLIPN